jgi:hypothetical protein
MVQAKLLPELFTRTVNSYSSPKLGEPDRVTTKLLSVPPQVTVSVLLVEVPLSVVWRISEA